MVVNQLSNWGGTALTLQNFKKGPAARLGNILEASWTILSQDTFSRYWRLVLDHTFSLYSNHTGPYFFTQVLIFTARLRPVGLAMPSDFVGPHLRSDDYHSCGYINYRHYIWIIYVHICTLYINYIHQLCINYTLTINYIYIHIHIYSISYIYICLMVRLPGHQWFGDPRGPLRRRFRRRTGNRRDTWWKNRHRFGVSMAATSWFYNPRYINSSIGI